MATHDRAKHGSHYDGPDGIEDEKRLHEVHRDTDKGGVTKAAHFRVCFLISTSTTWWKPQRGE